MSNAVTPLDKILEEAGLTAIWEARGAERAEERKALDIAQNMVNLGLPFETVVSATMPDPEK